MLQQQLENLKHPTMSSRVASATDAVGLSGVGAPNAERSSEQREGTLR